MAYISTAYIVMAYIVMAYILMTCIVMAYIVIADPTALTLPGTDHPAVAWDHQRHDHD